MLYVPSNLKTEGPLSLSLPHAKPGGGDANISPRLYSGLFRKSGTANKNHIEHQTEVIWSPRPTVGEGQGEGGIFF